jgi:hypothetical protein
MMQQSAFHEGCRNRYPLAAVQVHTDIYGGCIKHCIPSIFVAKPTSGTQLPLAMPDFDTMLLNQGTQKVQRMLSSLRN